MTCTVDSLPRLVPGSRTAKLLYRVWSGERIVSAWDEDSLFDAPGIAATITAHMMMRAGFSVAIVGDEDKVERSERILRAWIPDDLINPKRAPWGRKPPMVRIVTQVDFQKLCNFRPSDLFDLVIAADPHGYTDEGTMVNLKAARQFVSFYYLGRIYLEDRNDLVVPLDVALAGGVD